MNMSTDRNPYEPPKTDLAAPASGGWSLVGIPPTAAVITAFIGACNNAVNAAVCPGYFSLAMGWPMSDHFWLRCVLQGVWQGGLYGLGFGAILFGVAAVITGFRCRYRDAIGYVLVAAASAWVVSLLCGAVGFAWGAVSPDSFVAAFPLAEESLLPQFAWVGGNIDGGVMGGLLIAIATSVAFGVRWRRNQSVE